MVSARRKGETERDRPWKLGPCYRVGVAHIQRPGTSANLSPVSGSSARSTSPHREREREHSPACIYVPTYLVRAASPPSHASRDSRNPHGEGIARSWWEKSAGTPPYGILHPLILVEVSPPFFFTEFFRKGRSLIGWSGLARTTDVWGEVLQEVFGYGNTVEVGGWL